MSDSSLAQIEIEPKKQASKNAQKLAATPGLASLPGEGCDSSRTSEEVNEDSQALATLPLLPSSSADKEEGATLVPSSASAFPAFPSSPADKEEGATLAPSSASASAAFAAFPSSSADKEEGATLARSSVSAFPAFPSSPADKEEGAALARLSAAAPATLPPPHAAAVLSSALNGLNGREWTQHSKSVQTFNGAIVAKRKEHGAAFPLTLAKHFINVYSKPGDWIFDPFCGVGTTLDAANLLKRHAIGIELSKKFYRLNRGIDPKDGRHNPDYQMRVINDDTMNVVKHLSPDSVDMILTSPPYASLLNNIRENFADKDYKGNPYKNQSRRLARPYSKDASDLGNISYDDYLQKIRTLFALHHSVAKEGCYNLWVVRDYRDLKNNIPYVNLHGDLINIAVQTGWVMWDLIVWDQSNQRKLVRLGGNKSRRYYFNIGHSFVLVFRKNMKGETF